MNALKPLITNDVIEIHPKGRAPYMSPNTANYLLLSNHMDGAPVTDGDRRYMFLRSAIELDEVRAMSADGYFDRLFGAVRGRPGAVRAWLLGYSLHPELTAEGRAPDTEMREAVIEAVKSDLESVIDDLIDDGGLGKTFFFSQLVTAVKLSGVQFGNEKQLAGVISRRGYRFGVRTLVGEKRERVWTCDTPKASGEWLAQQKRVVATEKV